MNARHRGYEFERQWKEALYGMGWAWVYKFADARAMKGFMMPKAPKVPCDFITVKSNSVVGFYECKQTKQKALDFDAIKPHQLDELSLLSTLGCSCWFVVNFNNRLRGEERYNRVFLVAPAQLIQATDYYGLTRRSIPIAWFETNGICYEWVKLEDGEHGWRLK